METNESHKSISVMISFASIIITTFIYLGILQYFHIINIESYINNWNQTQAEILSIVVAFLVVAPVVIYEIFRISISKLYHKYFGAI